MNAPPKNPIRVTRIVIFLVICITALGFYSLYRNLTNELESQTFQATEESMVETTHLLAGLLETKLNGSEINFQELDAAFRTAKAHHFSANIHGFKKDTLGSNYYITDSKGIVLHDSARPERIGADYAKNNDVFLALKDQYAVRSSRDVESKSSSSILYIAVPIKNSTQEIVGVISVYKPQNDVRAFIDKRHRSILISLALIGTGITLFTIAVFVWLFRPLGKLIGYTRAIARGQRPPYPALGKGHEVNTLGKALHDMRTSLDGRSYMEQYTQMLTHELKSPLAAISGAAELLDEDMPVEHRRKFIDNIRRETTRSTKIIDGLLKLSQLESQSQLLQKNTIQLEKIIHSACDSLKPRLNTKGIQLDITTSPDHSITGDSMMLETALTNLLENAIQFSPQGGTITIVTTDADGSITLSITDQGAGIPDYAKDRVFERFYSHHPDHSEHRKGSGLGLVFVQEVAKLHNGTATLENSPEGGATATLSFPS